MGASDWFSVTVRILQPTLRLLTFYNLVLRLLTTTFDGVEIAWAVLTAALGWV